MHQDCDKCCWFEGGKRLASGLLLPLKFCSSGAFPGNWRSPESSEQLLQLQGPAEKEQSPLVRMELSHLPQLNMCIFLTIENFDRKGLEMKF